MVLAMVSEDLVLVLVLMTKKRARRNGYLVRVAVALVTW